MSLRNHGIHRRQLREGGGRGTGTDHVEELFGSTELYIYQTPNTRPKGYSNLKLYLGGAGMRGDFHRRRPA